MELNTKYLQMISKAVKFYLANLRKSQMENVASALLPGSSTDIEKGALTELEIEEYTKLNYELDVCLEYREYPLSD